MKQINKSKTPLHIQLQEQREIRHRDFAGMITESSFNTYTPSYLPRQRTRKEIEICKEYLQSEYYDDTYEDVISLDTITTFNEFNYGGIING